MNKIILAFVLLASISIFSCNESKPVVEKVAKETPAFVGAWELIKMDLGGEVINANILGNPTYTFNIDNTYVIRASAQSEQGSWTIKGDKLVLFSKSLEKETVLKIIDTTENILTYEIGEETITKVFLRRAKQF
jgi:hypothetical protein